MSLAHWSRFRNRRRRGGGSGGGGGTPMQRFLAASGYDGDRFSIYDITDLENITRLGGATDFDLNTVRPVFKIPGEQAVLAASDVNGQVTLWDITNKILPVLLDDLADIDYSDIRDFKASGGFVYAPSRDDNYLAVLAYDLEAPSLSEHGNYDGAFSNFDGPQMCVISPSGSHLYAPAFDDDGIEIIDISDPSSPSRVGLFQPTGISANGPSCMTVKAGVMFFVESSIGDVWAIDITDESDPVETPLDTLAGGGVAIDGGRWCELSADGDYLYITTNTQFVVVSVADPENMSIAGSVALPDIGYEVKVGPDGYAYVPCGDDDSVQIIDAFTDPSTPAIVTEIQDATELDDCRGVTVWEQEQVSVPAAISDLTATLDGVTTIDLAWTLPEDATGVKVYRHTSTFTPPGTGTLVASLGPVEVYEDSGLSAETEYFYRIIAVNDGGDSDPSNEDSDTTGAAVSGGTESESGGFRYHVFEADDDLIVAAETTVDAIIVAGGGGGQNPGFAGFWGGGGGAGGVIFLEDEVLSADTYPIVVGAGGDGADGDDSTFNGETAVGGGAGGATQNGNAGGSGGGAGSTTSARTGGAGTADQGNDGGGSTGGGSSAFRSGGGGGGAGAVGGEGVNGQGGDGGVGIEVTEFSAVAGSPAGWFGGGGGGSEGQATNPVGGQGGGGDGGDNGSLDGVDGVDGSGGGGGGCGNGNTSSGGNGIVIIRYPI